MRVVLIAMLITALPAPAFAQKTGLGQSKQTIAAPEIVEDQKKRKAAQDKAYKDALDQIPDRKPADPWGKVR